MHACPRHDPWKSLWTAKSYKGETGIPDAIIGKNQLREITPTENPSSSMVVGVEHKGSNLVL